jgi:hypothetical protein
MKVPFRPNQDVTAISPKCAVDSGCWILALEMQDLIWDFQRFASCGQMDNFNKINS